MGNISTSASKIAFLSLIGSSCAAFLYLVVAGKITIDPKDFQSLVFAAAGYYFGYKPSNGPTDPLAGK